MARYRYKALENNKDFREGEIEAESPRDARAKIVEAGYLPVKITEILSGENSPFLPLKDKILFTSELQVLLSAGIPIIEALSSCAENAQNLKIKKISLDIREALLEGKSLHEVMTERYKDTFGAVYTGLIKAGENSGELEKAFERVLLLLRKQDTVKSKIINASLYPCVLIVLMFGVLLLFSKFVFPAFEGIIDSNGGDIPPLASLLFGICNFVNNFWWLIIILMAGGVFYFLNSLKNVEFKKHLDKFIISVPVVSDFVRCVNLSNFLTVMHLAYDAGISVMSALELASATVENLVIKKKVANSLNLVKNGSSITQALQKADVLPFDMLAIVSAGEKSGMLGKMFADCASVIDKKVDMALTALTKLFEPTVMVIIGAVVLFIVLAFYQMYAGMLGSLAF